MSEVAAPRVLSPVQQSADRLDRVAGGVIFLAVLTGIGSVFGGLVAILHGDDGSHPFLGQGLVWAVGGGLVALTVAMLAVWAKTYAAVVRQSTSD